MLEVMEMMKMSDQLEVQQYEEMLEMMEMMEMSDQLEVQQQEEILEMLKMMEMPGCVNLFNYLTLIGVMLS